MSRDKAWQEAREYSPVQLQLARDILEDIRAGARVNSATRKHPQPEGGFIGKHILVHVYRQLTDSGEWSLDPQLVRQIRMKPSRTLSGVTIVTVLTKPYPCPGNCIFCPTDVRMPKSYLPDEPGAMRALHHEFEPYEQTRARIEALESIGHPTDKIELLVLGGTWSSYQHDYQEWFLQRCLDAMNGFDSGSLEDAQKANENAKHKNVGLVIETRPDWIDNDEIARLRRLGVTKVQLGAQSLDDRILDLNNRGHSVEETRKAIALLRAGGFKIVLHWMPNLLGATLESDREDFQRLWEDHGIRPDELKIYPCQLLEKAELHEYWSRGEYKPYTTEELIDLIADLKVEIPRYCRVNRVVRDIPSNNVVEGNRRTSLRQDIQNELAHRGHACSCIRCREVRDVVVEQNGLEMDSSRYTTLSSDEYFISFHTGEDQIAGYLRLSLPNTTSPDLGLPDLVGAAIIREVHVYGQSLMVGEEQLGAAQHSGLGIRLMQEAEEIAHAHGYESIAVISALGTRGYYRARGYSLGDYYMVKAL
jgi:elongator complex protein 3